MKKRGISLIVLVITIIVILILAGIVIFTIGNSGILDNSKKAKFMSDFRIIEEGVDIYSISNIDISNPNNYTLPIESKLTLADKQAITDNVPTLKTKIEELNSGKTINDIDLYWINEPVIGANNISLEKRDKGYIIDISTRQVYDYYGDYFYSLRWHTLDGGVVETPKGVETITEEIWDGWIKLTLYYPSSSTARQWRLGTEGELRADPMTMWQDYTGPITIPLDRIKDVWIKYKLNGEDITIPPAGTLLVDIVPDSTGTNKVDKVSVKINYDSSATTKEYRVGNSGWMSYIEPFVVTENCVVEARAKKTENVYNTDGSLLMTRDIAGSDMVYIGNIGTNDLDNSGMENTPLPAPTITRLPSQSEDEVARVQITYPAAAFTKIYTVNYGNIENYTSEISIKSYGTYIIAYYYDANGIRSMSSSIYINDTSKGDPAQGPTLHEPLPPYDPINPTNPSTTLPYDPKTTVDLAAPIITRLASLGSEKARVQITYPAQAVSKIYTKNYGTEQIYSQIINVDNWGTYIMAYYYDKDGNKSRVAYIRINEISTPAGEYPPLVLPIPSAPTINIDPSTGIVSEVAVSVSSPAEAAKTYIKLGRNGIYQEYTAPITVRDNIEVYAYYMTYDGKKSQEARARITNINTTLNESTNNKPYVCVDAVPYPYSGSYGASKVTVTVKHEDADTIEYSEDGIVYKSYTGPFEVTKNGRIYAKGTNVNGVTEDYLDITNIGILTPPIPKQILAVNINVDPEPALSTTKVASATVLIEYDANATEKYYRLGMFGALKTYTGSFSVTSNCTVYAFARGTNAAGSAVKTIDNISSGISEPVIIASPGNSVQSSKVNVSITYDQSATIKRYSVNGGALRDYATSFDVTENGTVIYAYSENALGQKSESKYTIENIVPEIPVLILDKGDYYLLKLNYPTGSKNREYKWKKDGIWTTYKDAGIMLIKPQFKDKLIQNGTLVKIKDENERLVTFTGDYYLIDVPISELSENLFMRWDRVTPPAPKIIINPTTSTKQVTATITYDSMLVRKQYRVVKPGETPEDWKDYTGPIVIDKNNSVIYAKGMDETEVSSYEGMYKVTNIDEISPVITLTTDLTTAGQKVPVKVSVKDNLGVGVVKLAFGLQGESYFANSGTEIPNNSIVNITENGYYTFYAEDKVGNTQVYTLNVTNVDLTPPAIDIAVSPETTVATSTNVTITYDPTATTKQYKVGTSNTTWSNYTGTFAISSYTVLTNNWKNSDGTVTIYAKAKDSVGNEVTVQKKIMNLDLDIPNVPVINSNAGYALFTGYGPVYNKETTIVYDSRTDIDNYYSIDSGATWMVYNGKFDMISGTVIAKSVKKNTGLEATVSKTIAMPSDAITAEAYDGNDSTYMTGVVNNYKMYIDSTLSGKSMNFKYTLSAYRKLTFTFIDASGNILSTFTKLAGVALVNYDESYTIPAGTKTLQLTPGTSLGAVDKAWFLYEIKVSNEPTFSAINGYITLTADPTKSINSPYQMVTVNYFPTSVQRLYKIGTSGNWLNYNDQPIKVDQDQTIYAKGIDQYGNETRIVSSYTSNVTDAIVTLARDGDDTTYMSGVVNNYKMYIDSSLSGKNINFKYTLSAYRKLTFTFMDASGNVLSTFIKSSAPYTAASYDESYIIPVGTKTVQLTPSTTLGVVDKAWFLYEIRVGNEPTFSGANGYITLTADPTKSINSPYQMVTVNYFPTSVQRLYKIGTSGNWLSYNDQPIKVDQDQTIYAKGIDQYGNETRIISSYTPNVPDAIIALTRDGDDTTYMTGVKNDYKIYIDPSLSGKSVNFKYKIVQSRRITFTFLDGSGNVLNTFTKSGAAYTAASYDEPYIIPAGTKILQLTPYSTFGDINNAWFLYEIRN